MHVEKDSSMLTADMLQSDAADRCVLVLHTDALLVVRPCSLGLDKSSVCMNCHTHSCNEISDAQAWSPLQPQIGCDC